MKTTLRFENAVSKLYRAFHADELSAWDCTACAVGNICNNSGSWSHIRMLNDDLLISYPLKKNWAPDTESVVESTGYSAQELIKIELVFLKAIGAQSDGIDKDDQFKGLCAVVKYLCNLDGIPNIMDFTSLFETENDTPKRQLQEVFSN